MILFTRNNLEALFHRLVRRDDWLFENIYGYDNVEVIWDGLGI